MEINPNRKLDPVTLAYSPSKAKQASAADGETSFEQSSGLNAALSATPDSRADVVARAERLVADPSYPPPQVIERIANLLAANMITQEG
jgi:hypothetical protein